LPNFRQAVQLNGIPPLGLVSALVVATTTYTALATDSIILCNATTAAFTVSLPTAVGITGRVYTIKKTDSSAHAVTVDPNGSQTIDGQLTFPLAFQYEYIAIVSDGANWQIIDSVLYLDATVSDLQPAAPVAVAGATGKLPDAGHVHPLPGQADTTSNVVTATGSNALSKAWTLPAGLPAGAAYRLTAFGHGQQATTTAVQFNFNSSLGGTTFMGTDIANTVVAANTTFHWFVTIILIVTGTGTSGTTMAGASTAFGQAAVATGANQTAPPADTNPSGPAINTTITNAFQLLGGWASTTGSPTITCVGSLLEPVAA
jgi:hypothetical protein